MANLRRPHITGTSPNEKADQIVKFLVYLVDELQIEFNDLEPMKKKYSENSKKGDVK